MYYETISFLPHIPKNLLDDLDTIESYENVFPAQGEYVKTYASYVAPEPLADFMQLWFDYPVLTRYQVIKKALHVHVDVGIKGVKYNYILDTGGDVKTRWWNDVDEKATTILHEVQSEPFVWHSLNISEPHNITEPSRPRVSVVVRKK